MSYCVGSRNQTESPGCIARAFSQSAILPVPFFNLTVWGLHDCKTVALCSTVQEWVGRLLLASILWLTFYSDSVLLCSGMLQLKAADSVSPTHFKFGSETKYKDMKIRGLACWKESRNNMTWVTLCPVKWDVRTHTPQKEAHCDHLVPF